jgi:hypothetical protein
MTAIILILCHGPGIGVRTVNACAAPTVPLWRITAQRRMNFGSLISFKRYCIADLTCSRDLLREIIEGGLKKVRRMLRWKVSELSPEREER